MESHEAQVVYQLTLTSFQGRVQRGFSGSLRSLVGWGLVNLKFTCHLSRNLGTLHVMEDVNL